MSTITKTAGEYRAEASAHHEEAAASFERSDTDGFLSQAASGIMGRLAEARATIAENGGMAEFPALFDLDGNLVPAKLTQGDYGMFWGLLSDPEDPSSAFTAYVSPSKARDEDVRRRNMAKKGYYEGTIRTKAAADLGSPRGATGVSGMLSVYVDVFRLDRGYSADVEIVDNGIAK